MGTIGGRTFSDQEVEAIQARYPRLIRIAPDKLEGWLDFAATYENETVEDSFQICITLLPPWSHLPELREVGGRTAMIATKWNITDLRDLHCGGGGACLCVKQEERKKFPSGSDFLVFIEQLVVPYLYGLSYFDSNGQWRWGEYSHGSLGLLEYYADDVSPQTKEAIAEILPILRREDDWEEIHKQIRKPSAAKPCLCGSGKPFGECHQRALLGVRRLHDEQVRLGFRPKGLLRSM